MGASLGIGVHLKLLLWLFVAVLAVQSAMFAVATLFHPIHTYWFFPLFPAIWIAMAVGGVHSAGGLSCAVGLITASAIYAPIALGAVRLSTGLFRRSKR